MKILYSAGDRLGAAHQLFGFLEYTAHDVKVAAYQKSSRLISFTDWMLDSVLSDNHNLELLQQDIKIYDPDLVLIDGEPIVANIANELSIPILYCSPLHILDGISWKRGTLSYSAPIEKLRSMLNLLPIGISKLIYSPFGDIEGAPIIKNGFDWVCPYHVSVDESQSLYHNLMIVEDNERVNLIETLTKKLKLQKVCSLNLNYETLLRQTDWILSTGETQHVADALYNNKRISLIPNINDVETLLNAIMCSYLKIADDLGQIELMEFSATYEIEKSYNHRNNFRYSVNDNKKMMLHERVDYLWECL